MKIKLKKMKICSIINYVNLKTGDKKLRKTISIIKQNEQNVAEIMRNGVEEDILFRELQKDTVGRSGSSPTWGYVYSNDNGKLNFKGIALHKEYDYDFLLQDRDYLLPEKDSFVRLLHNKFQLYSF